MPPSIESKAGVPGGISETCLFNDHDQCRSPRCGCTCHNPVPAPEAQATQAEQRMKSCPVCGVKRPATETYCRLDGARLASLLCQVCGAGKEPEDKFCFNCGADSSAPPPAKVTTIPTVPEAETDDQAILKSIQEEMKNAGVPIQTAIQTEAATPAPQAGGTFRLVPKANPNKIRGVNTGPGGVEGNGQPRLRLPFKPS